MTAIALVGPDGAGKTTHARRLEASGVLPFKYLYMGVNVSSSNVALPSSRLAARLKRRRRGGPGSPPDAAGRAPAPPPRPARGRLWAAARLLNRLAEEWYRQALSWYHQRRGRIVLYDRHFVLDYRSEPRREARRLDRRIHAWLLFRFYPRPDLVLYLDAPPEVLLGRKGESTLEELERRRRVFLDCCAESGNVIRVDADRPAEEVQADLLGLIVRFCGGRGESERA